MARDTGKVPALLVHRALLPSQHLLACFHQRMLLLRLQPNDLETMPDDILHYLERPSFDQPCFPFNYAYSTLPNSLISSISSGVSSRGSSPRESFVL